MKIRYYRSFTDDFVESADQSRKVPEDYRWIRRDLRSRFLSGLIYGTAILFSSVYLPLGLHMGYKGREKLKEVRGAFLYCNHTQPFGDVFMPALPCLPNRIYTVVSPANLGIPVIGKLLPYLGALPIPDTIGGMRKFTEALEQRLGEGHPIAIFPEAHVWEYYTGIRPFPESAFKYPVKYRAPSYALTVTYQKRRFGKRPRATVHIDGPFYPDERLSRREQPGELRDRIRGCMLRRAGESDCDFIRYILDTGAEKDV